MLVIGLLNGRPRCAVREGSFLRRQRATPEGPFPSGATAASAVRCPLPTAHCPLPTAHCPPRHSKCGGLVGAYRSSPGNGSEQRTQLGQKTLKPRVRRRRRSHQESVVLKTLRLRGSWVLATRSRAAMTTAARPPGSAATAGPIAPSLETQQ